MQTVSQEAVPDKGCTAWTSLGCSRHDHIKSNAAMTVSTPFCESYSVSHRAVLFSKRCRKSNCTMSPVDPLSPTSLPSTPTTPLNADTFDATSEFLATRPPKGPTISPILHLPRLVTSFNSTWTLGHLCHSPLQFSLPTPSPLTLTESPQSPRSAIEGRKSCSPLTRPRERRRDQTNSTGRVSHGKSKSSSSDVSDLVLPSPLYLDKNTAHKRLPAISPTVPVGIKRFDIMEDLNPGDSQINNSIIEQIVRLPLRKSPSSSPTPFVSPFTKSSVRRDSEAALSPTSKPYSSTKRPIHASTPRSPIHKRVRTQHRSTQTSNSQAQTQAQTQSRTQPQSQSKSQSHRRRRRWSAIHRRILTLPPIDKHTKLVVRTTSSTSPTTAAVQAKFTAAVAHLATPLVPLISVRTGLAHPHFPRSLLKYHLLTHEQLDALARWYHQTHDAGLEAEMYPAPLGRHKVWTFSTSPHSYLFPATTAITNTTTKQEGKDATGQIVSLSTKRRRWGRFIGLRACESPVSAPSTAPTRDRDGKDDDEDKDKDREDLEAKMEKQWRDALRRADEERGMMQKMWRGRF